MLIIKAQLWTYFGKGKIGSDLYGEIYNKTIHISRVSEILHRSTMISSPDDALVKCNHISHILAILVKRISKRHPKCIQFCIAVAEIVGIGKSMSLNASCTRRFVVN